MPDSDVLAAVYEQLHRCEYERVRLEAKNQRLEAALRNLTNTFRHDAEIYRDMKVTDQHAYSYRAAVLENAADLMEAALADPPSETNKE